MTDLQFFAFVALPLAIAAFGGVIVLVFELRHRRAPEPDLFDPPPRRTLANSEGLRVSSRTSKR